MNVGQGPNALNDGHLSVFVICNKPFHLLLSIFVEQKIKDASKLDLKNDFNLIFLSQYSQKVHKIKHFNYSFDFVSFFLFLPFDVSYILPTHLYIEKLTATIA